MRLERSKPDHSEAMLRAVCAVRSSAWCFAPAERDTISFCSRGFTKLFQLPSDVEPPLAFLDSRLKRAFERDGLPVDWMYKLAGTPCENSTGPTLIEMLRELNMIVYGQIVVDADGRPIGRMFTFESPLDQKLPREIWQDLQEAREQLSILSKREHQILDLVYDGLTNKAIGIRASISEKTVEKHRSNIMQKLGIRTAVELVRCVSKAKMVQQLTQVENDRLVNH